MGMHRKLAQAALLAGLFELGGELRSAIDLQGTEGKGHTVQQSLRELSGAGGGRSAMGLNHVPARDYIAGSELLEHDSRHRAHLQSVDLD